MITFVREWAGNPNYKYILENLERHEQSMETKRKLHPADLEDLTRIKALELERFIPAMVKAKLNSPADWTDSLSYSLLFPAKGTDITGITVGKPCNLTRAVDIRRLNCD